MADSSFEPEISLSLRMLSKELGLVRMLSTGLAIECKKVSASANLSFDMVKEHQEKGMTDAMCMPFVTKMRVSAAVGGGVSRFQQDTPFDFLLMPCAISYILVNFRFTKKSPRKDITKGLNSCYAIPIYWYLHNKKELLKEGKKSMDIRYIDEASKQNSGVIQLERIRYETGVTPAGKTAYQYGWNLHPLVEAYIL